MKSARKHPTIADLAAIALCPSLIVLLLACLVYFLVLCIYHGQYSGRIGYIWFMFIMGAVGIARLSIEQSRTYAATYALLLGGATWFVLSRFMVVQGPLASLSFLINGGMIALVWVLADRITFDCTLIDEGEDASGQGLLDGLANHEGDQDLVKSDQAAQATRRRRHQPGKTVLWLAAAALPIFGLGQWMLPQDERWQASAVMALGGYLFATLSLLVATSFLGVRRYLRQRGVDMPTNVTGAWLIGGILMTVALLAVCFMLPMPGKMIADMQLPSSIDSPDWLKPSRYGWGGESANPGTPSDAPGQGEAQPEDAQNAAGGPDGKQPSGQIGDGPQAQQSGGQEKGASSATSKDRSESQEASSNQGQSPSTKGNDSPDQQTQSEAAQAPSKAQSQSGQKSGDQKSGDQKSGEKPNQSSPSQQSPQSKASSPSQPKTQPSDSQEKPKPESQQAEQSLPAEQPPPSEQPPPAETPPPEPPQDNGPSWLSQMMPSLSGILKAMVYVVLFGIIAIFAWLNRHELRAAWQRLLKWISGRTSASDVTEDIPSEPSSEAVTPPKPFASYRNPIEQGADPARAVVVTYQAAEAWWRERGLPRRRDETPIEFAKRVSSQPIGDHGAMQKLTDAYNRLLYGDNTVQKQDMNAVKSMWDAFGRAK